MSQASKQPRQRLRRYWRAPAMLKTDNFAFFRSDTFVAVASQKFGRTNPELTCEQALVQVGTFDLWLWLAGPGRVIVLKRPRLPRSSTRQNGSIVYHTQILLNTWVIWSLLTKVTVSFLQVHDEKDKDFELEISWICPASNYEVQDYDWWIKSPFTLCSTRFFEIHRSCA